MNVMALGVLALVAGTACAQNLNGAGADPSRTRSTRGGFLSTNKVNPSVKINYQPIGSGGGIRQVTEGTVDFGASDVTMTDAQIAEAKVKVMAVPTVMGAVVPVYNLPGVSQELKFSQDAIAGIYLGKITKWNDPYIAKENPGVNLPDKAILPVYRTDGSGTTFIFTDYLSKISPEWLEKVGRGCVGEVAFGDRRQGQ